MNQLHGTWAKNAGKPRWGDKTPHYLTEIPTLLELFPEAKIIHIYRDGRDVALSWLRTRMEPRNTFVAARYWADRVTEGLRVGRSLPPGKYLEVRYETLLSETRATMMRVCDFLGEESCEEVLAPTFVDLGPMFGFKRRKKGIRRIQVVTDNANKWRRQCPSATAFCSSRSPENCLMNWATKPAARAAGSRRSSASGGGSTTGYSTA